MGMRECDKKIKVDIIPKLGTKIKIVGDRRKGA